MRRRFFPTVLAFCLPCLAQSPVILDLDLQNETNYLYDVFDYSKNGTDPATTAVNGGFRNFAISVAVDDIVAVNGRQRRACSSSRDSARGLGLTRLPGLSRRTLTGAAYDLYVEILQPDGTPIGTVTASGMFAGPVPPGSPATGTGTSSNFAITGGTGAFLGARGRWSPFRPGQPARPAVLPQLRRSLPIGDRRSGQATSVGSFKSFRWSGLSS